MNDEQLLRYSRHILLPEIGVEGQEKLLASSAKLTVAAQDQKKALDSGCSDFDGKPVNLPRLLSKIEALLKRSEQPAT